MSKNYTDFTFRTDLANETHELILEKYGSENDGIIFKSTEKDGINIDYMEVLNAEGEKVSGKPCGKYTTINIGKVWILTKEDFKKKCDVVSDEIRKFIPNEGSCLLAALGNRGIIADAIGPECASNFIVTRHIKKANLVMFESFGMRETSCIIPGVSGNTGLEAAETVRGIVKNTSPDFVIAIDALASRRLARLATTVQICDTGISPGSGIGNARVAINKDYLGVPVISIGIPTVVDAVTLALDIFEEVLKKHSSSISEKEILEDLINPKNNAFFVAPKETDHIIKDTAKLLGYAINGALHENLYFDDMAEFLM